MNLTQRRYKLLVAGIIALLLLSSFSCYTIIRDGNRIETAQLSYKSASLSRQLVAEFISIVERTREGTVGWVYLQSNTENKNAVIQIIAIEYPQLKNELLKISGDWPVEEQTALKKRFSEYDELSKIAREQIFSALATFENYEDPTIRFLAENAIESDVLPAAGALIRSLRTVEETSLTTFIESEKKSGDVISTADLRSLILSITMFVAGIIGLIIVLTAPKTSVVAGPKISSPLAEKKVDLIKWVAALDEQAISEIESLRRKV